MAVRTRIVLVGQRSTYDVRADATVAELNATFGRGNWEWAGPDNGSVFGESCVVPCLPAQKQYCVVSTTGNFPDCIGPFTTLQKAQAFRDKLPNSYVWVAVGMASPTDAKAVQVRNESVADELAGPQ